MAEHEHLYRDEAKAALERACRLAEENAELRRQLARYRDGRDVPTLRTRRRGVPADAFGALAAAVTLLVAGIASTIVFAADEQPVVTEGPASFTHARAAVTPYERSDMPRRFKDEGTCLDEPSEE